MSELTSATDPETTRSILGVLALWKGLETSGRLLIDFTEDELAEMENQYLGLGDKQPAG